ncbi:hypothetical protein ACFV80_32770 [Streptomyces sp. NPDC059862]|uniref:hypothetical protein n=1 Tax=Streptomyces sp. NPDC059862 TaxID=3346975 RepID=UPI00365BEA6B
MHFDRVIGSWDGRPSARWRKRIAQHARDCSLCSGHQAGLVPAEGLLAGLGLVPMPTTLTDLAGLTALNDAEHLPSPWPSTRRDTKAGAISRLWEATTM